MLDRPKFDPTADWKKTRIEVGRNKKFFGAKLQDLWIQEEDQYL